MEGKRRSGRPHGAKTRREASARVRQLVQYYIDNIEDFRRIHLRYLGYFQNSDFVDQIHSVRSRVKDPKHFEDKLQRMVDKAFASGRAFAITEANVFKRVYDCIGFRFLHIRREDFPTIDRALQNLLSLYKLEIVKGPVARVWDPRAEEYFKGLGIKTEDSGTMYTSVHYTVAMPEGDRYFEIQVRTLMEEVWGEVDHTFNYPHPSKSASCREQIVALARIVSGANQLVDSIYNTQVEHVSLLVTGAQARPRKR
jgi:ppGpp synthetase/RelA/SpoT-type nucleotidyltranferase